MHVDMRMLMAVLMNDSINQLKQMLMELKYYDGLIGYNRLSQRPYIGFGWIISPVSMNIKTRVLRCSVHDVNGGSYRYIHLYPRTYAYVRSRMVHSLVISNDEFVTYYTKYVNGSEERDVIAQFVVKAKYAKQMLEAYESRLFNNQQTIKL